MTGAIIAIIIDYLFGKNPIEALNVKEALEYYDNKVFILESNAKLISELKRNDIEIAFNLARNRFGNQYNASVASICELLEIDLIGPNVFTSTICNDKKTLFNLLKWDAIKTIESFQESNDFKSINVSTLGSECEFILLLDLHNNYNISLIPSNSIKETCKTISRAIHIRDFCEFHIFIDRNQNIYIYDVNPTPFLDKNSNSAILFELMGSDYVDFINFFILNSYKRNKASLSENYLELEEKMLKITQKIVLDNY